jgi:ABC-type Mn2+/Zn2+ transport system ATPase subunit
VRGGKLHYYACGYDKFLALREERMVQAVATAATQAAEIARLEEFVARFGAKASKASQAQSRAKQLEKLRADVVEIPAAAAAVGPGDARKVALRLPPPPPCTVKVLQLRGASVGWGAAPADASDDRRPLLDSVDLTVVKGQRILVLGPNGAGKSTLLKAVSGALPLWAGERLMGDGAKLAVFSQDLAQDLPLQSQALDYVLTKAREEDPMITMEAGRKTLGALGISGSMALRKIGELSGGEKARVALAAFALIPSNVLLLDEASNHLDLQTLEALTGALRGYGGAIIAITHNRAFATSLQATHILRVEGGAATMSDNKGLTAADFEHRPVVVAAPAAPAAAAPKVAAAPAGKRAATATAAPPAVAANGKGKKGAATPAAVPAAATPAPPAPSTSGAGAAPAAGGKRKLGWKEAEEYKAVQSEIAKLNAKLEAINASIGGLSGAKLQEATHSMGALSADIEAKSVRWLELAELAGDL